MCNLYSLDRGQDAIRRAFGVDRDETGNPPPLPAIFLDRMAPVVRSTDREIARRVGVSPSTVASIR